MKSKNIFTAFFLAGTVMLGFSQTKSTFKRAKDNIPETLFTPTQTDTIVVSSIEMLGKLEYENFPDAYKINLLPQNYSWTNDASRAERLKDMASELRRQDCNGRDLPTNVHQEVIQKVYLIKPTER
ncbi:hypothetical protein [Flavobacterium sp.]|uniref:hypothetical protein n=1 Tax=Flavobacterium sp. TaxID=239 RepID=UPI0024886D1C|nr:hypothetical protein [Flavobacterium sp.]MDI1317643.1 hypothetical protein [Flavobacterium sp.]